MQGGAEVAVGAVAGERWSSGLDVLGPEAEGAPRRLLVDVGDAADGGRCRRRNDAAAAGADWARSFYQILTNQPGKEAWPITGATFIMMHARQDKAQQAQSALKFFDWAYTNGDSMSEELDYVPLPTVVEDSIRQLWSKITDASGKPVGHK